MYSNPNYYQEYTDAGWYTRGDQAQPTPAPQAEAEQTLEPDPEPDIERCDICDERIDHCICNMCEYCGENQDAGDCGCDFCDHCGENITAGNCACEYCDVCGITYDPTQDETCNCADNVANGAQQEEGEQTPEVVTNPRDNIWHSAV
jgi:hypothetical protein